MQDETLIIAIVSNELFNESLTKLSTELFTIPYSLGTLQVPNLPPVLSRPNISLRLLSQA